jgi:hypothetical protein
MDSDAPANIFVEDGTTFDPIDSRRSTAAAKPNGAIRPGDLLTTSRIPGYAMRASPILMRGVKIYRTGTIVGKALEPLKEGKRVIKVLVTLR